MHMNENKNKRACPSDTTFSPPKTKPKRRADWRTAGLVDLQDLVKIARPMRNAKQKCFYFANLETNFFVV